MQTTTLSLRVPKSEAAFLERAAHETGMERSALLKLALRQGCSDILFARACADYRAGRITLSRAAERAGLSLRELVARLPSADVGLNYDVQALEEDLEP